MYCANMPAKPLQISMDTGLLERIDADPEARKQGRSAFIRSAVQLYLTMKDRREMEARLTQAYGGKADNLLDEIGDFMSAQAWPER
jgi:hypothetical protein